MKYIAIIDADEKPVSCEFIGCNGNVAPYRIGATTNIKALEQEPCEDCISRKAVLNAIYDADGEMDSNYELDRSMCNKSDLADVIEDLPPVTPKPKTGRWISIENVMSVFNDFMCDDVDEDGTSIFLAMLKDKAESEETE